VDELIRILSLSGGGIRGILQSVFLERLESDLGTPLHRHFELISGTSTGGIVALAIAAGLSPREITNLYRQHGPEIFRPRFGGGLRRGARYKQTPLADALRRQFGNKRLGDLQTEVIITGSSLESFSGRVFSRSSDPQLSVVDIALATSAAPTYFPASGALGSERSYMDGGLWANNPALLAILHAQQHMAARIENLRLLSIGTGLQPSGITVAEANEIRTFSAKAIRFILEFLMSTQAWFSDTYAEGLLSHEHFCRVNPVLPERVGLDDAQTALRVLPAVAEHDYDSNRAKIQRLMNSWAATATAAREVKKSLPLEVAEPAVNENLSGFYPSRLYYGTHRGGRPTVDLYIELANTSLTMVSINLATGIAMDDIIAKFDELIRVRDRPVHVCVSLPNPSSIYLFETLAPVLDTNIDELLSRVGDCLRRLYTFRESLSDDYRAYMSVRTHNAIPNASAILIDHKTPDGRIQLETKPYKSAMQYSFGFEVRAGSKFYETLVSSYERLLSDGSSYNA
jgi:hypothetical protein